MQKLIEKNTVLQMKESGWIGVTFQMEKVRILQILLFCSKFYLMFMNSSNLCINKLFSGGSGNGFRLFHSLSCIAASNPSQSY